MSPSPTLRHLLWTLMFLTALSGSAQVYDLRCDGLRAPLGTESAIPHFSWKNTLTHNGQRQTAYEIEVASGTAVLESGQADLWRSGRIRSDTQVMVPYGGRFLKTRQLCHWRVRTWDERDSCSGWSRPQRFAVGPFTGILGDYIGCVPDDGTMAETPMLRTFLDYHPDGKSVFVYVNSLGYHELYINGMRVGEEVLQPAVSQLDKRSLIVTYDITRHLREGRNEILIWLGRGWYRDVVFDLHAEPVGNVSGAASVKVTGPLVKAEVCELSGTGSRTLAHTDTAWQASPSGYQYTDIWVSDLFGGERFDAGVRPVWRPATRFLVEGMTTCPQQFEGNRIIDTLVPKDTLPQDDGSVILDFGRVVTGWFQAEFEPMAPGSEVTMEYADHIFEDGVFHCRGERDYYIAGGAETQRLAPPHHGAPSLPPNTFRNRFHHHAFRYVRVKGAGIREAKALQVSALNPKEAASFRCSDSVMNDIHDLIRYTLQCLTFSGYMVDCPHIERLGYGGDGNSSTMTLQTIYDVLPTYLNWLTAWEDSQDEDGGLAYTAPAYRAAGGPYWSGFIVKAPWRTWVNYGDRRMIDRLYEPMKRWLDYVEGHFEDGLLQPWPDTGKRMMFLGDWLAPKGVDTDGESAIFVSNCFLSECYSDMAKMAKLLGYHEDCAFFTEKQNRLQAAIQARFYHPESHTYANGTPFDQVYALLLMLPGEDVWMNGDVYRRMLQDLEGKYNGHIAFGLMGIPVFAEWAAMMPYPERMVSMLRQPDYPGYRDMLRRGATTTWESWDGDRSRVHNCYNGIGTWFYQALAGIRPDENAPGYRNFLLDPQLPDDITWVEASKPTPYGEIRVRVDEEGIRLTVPVGSAARLYPYTRGERVIPAGRWIVRGGTVESLSAGTPPSVSTGSAAPTRPRSCR